MQVGDKGQFMNLARTYGDFAELAGSDRYEGLTIVFSPASLSLRKRWKNNSLSADFMGDYFAAFYTPVDTPESDRREEVKGTVSFVANELLENAMKFTDVDAVPITIRLTMQAGELVFFASNGVSVAGAADYEAAVQKLLTADLWAEYERRASAQGDSSGIGLLSMLTDYSARIGWRFAPQDEQRILTTTTVRIPL